jgi:hypothetical protein
MELIEKSYNLDYSDNRLRQIENLLKALSQDPSETDNQNEQPLILENQKNILQNFIKNIK